MSSLKRKSLLRLFFSFSILIHIHLVVAEPTHGAATLPSKMEPIGIEENVCLFSFVPRTDIFSEELHRIAPPSPQIVWEEDFDISELARRFEDHGGCTELILLLHSAPFLDSEVLVYTRPLTSPELTSLKSQTPDIPCDPCYKTFTPIFDRPFQKLKETVIQKSEDFHFRSLRRIRFIACNADKIIPTYGSLRSLSKSLNIAVDGEDPSTLLSLIHGQSVIAMDNDSVFESFQFEDDQHPYFFTYLNLYNIGIGALGETTALRGKYHIVVRSLSFGLSKLKTRVYIPYASVRDLKVHETTTLLLPRMGLNVALSLLKLTTSITPVPFLSGPTELDSFGASLDLMAQVEIERLY